MVMQSLFGIINFYSAKVFLKPLRIMWVFVILYRKMLLILSEYNV